VVLGLTTGVAGALYVALGKPQETIGLTQGMTVGLAMVIPAAAIALAVLLRHPRAAGAGLGRRSGATYGSDGMGTGQRGGRNPARVTVTSRWTAALDGRLPAAPRAWRQ